MLAPAWYGAALGASHSPAQAGLSALQLPLFLMAIAVCLPTLYSAAVPAASVSAGPAAQPQPANGTVARVLPVAAPAPVYPPLLPPDGELF